MLLPPVRGAPPVLVSLGTRCTQEVRLAPSLNLHGEERQGWRHTPRHRRMSARALGRQPSAAWTGRPVFPQAPMLPRSTAPSPRRVCHARGLRASSARTQTKEPGLFRGFAHGDQCGRVAHLSHPAPAPANGRSKGSYNRQLASATIKGGVGVCLLRVVTRCCSLGRRCPLVYSRGMATRTATIPWLPRLGEANPTRGPSPSGADARRGGPQTHCII